MTTDWMRDAVCRHKNADLWFPPMDANNPNDYFKIAKLACHRCPVWKECLQYGMLETWGMWGGLTPHERRGVVKLHHGTVECYRRGCICPECREANVRIPNRADLSLLPDQHEQFDVKSLLFTLIQE